MPKPKHRQSSTVIDRPRFRRGTVVETFLAWVLGEIQYSSEEIHASQRWVSAKRGGIPKLEPPALAPACAGQDEKLAGGHMASSPPSRLPTLSIKGNQRSKLYWKK